jgi:hypothetical protein
MQALKRPIGQRVRKIAQVFSEQRFILEFRLVDVGSYAIPRCGGQCPRSEKTRHEHVHVPLGQFVVINEHVISGYLQQWPASNTNQLHADLREFPTLPKVFLELVLVEVRSVVLKSNPQVRDVDVRFSLP